MSAASRMAGARRELPASWHIPYSAHVSPHVVTTDVGDYVQVFRLAGLAFETADDEDLNNWHERLAIAWRNIASPHLALWTHTIRRRESIVQSGARCVGFAEGLADKYRKRLSGETLMVNELFLSLVYRPVPGLATGTLARMLVNRAGEKSAAIELADSLDACEKLSQTLLASLARYEPDRLGIAEGGSKPRSALLEFLARLINAEDQPIPLPHAPIADVLTTTRALFGSETIEYRLPTKTRFAAMLGIKEYPTPTTVGMYNALLSAPFEFVLMRIPDEDDR